jgi:23S rRNA (cytidine1920-2'-O)/16S rRNA (cytidine1409-2'-O)-methyltransferase
LTKPRRLDAEMVGRGLATTRSEAKRLIEAGEVEVAGMPAHKPAAMVSADTRIEVVRERARFASRGGEKLDRALDRLQVVVAGRRWLDAGASTGGFTDCLLKRGAAEVTAVDVGYGQLDWNLRNDQRVHVMERTNIRDLDADALPWVPEGVVADLSFIPLTLVLPTLVSLAGPGTDYVLLVKPQFEVGRSAVPKGGVVRDPALWRFAMSKVIVIGEELGMGSLGVVPSEFPGPAGNREFFVHLRRDVASDTSAIAKAAEEAADEDR